MQSQLNKETIAKALREYRRANRSISYHICNNSPTFSSLWRSHSSKEEITKMAREFLKEQGINVYWIPDSLLAGVLFVPCDYTTVLEDIAVREDFLKYLKAKLP